ncbi:MAG: hypothetical protein L0K86_06045, partial [Actinomycetia bacterium]|nr:hypothetical protein [Actinomycetes bacterium]
TTRGGRGRDRPDPVSIPAMNPATWTLDVLPTGAENRLPLTRGRAPTVEGAVDAVVAAVVEVAAALGRTGRQEYRLTVAANEMIVIPGLTGDGLVDLESLRAIAGRWRPTGADATLTIAS